MKIHIRASSRTQSQFCGKMQLRHFYFNNVPITRLVTRTRALHVRPYTTRREDTIDSIAEKRGFSADDLRRLNHSMNVDSLKEGTTILLPSEKLSDRDREIIGGIGRKYRTYPVRKGETIEEITSKRNITMEEMKKLNPLTDFKNLKENMVLKLPAGKYTIRETEMLMGVLKVPAEYFQNKNIMLSTTVIGKSFLLSISTSVVSFVSALAALASLFVWWKGKTNKDN